MAQRRMFNKTITNNDNFLEMPDSSQNLYFHLSMNADDDGFVDNWKSIIRMTGHKEDDLKILIAKQYIIPFESGVIVIRHWRLNNYLQKDRITPTNYKEEKALLTTDLNNVYNLDTKCIHSIEENSIDKNSIDNKRFVKPTLEQIKEYCLERNNNVDSERFFNYYEANGWVQGKSRKPIKDWKACIRTWEQTDKKQDKPSWFNQDVTKEEMSEDELEQLRKELNL
jgi:hypothetical protein